MTFYVSKISGWILVLAFTISILHGFESVTPIIFTGLLCGFSVISLFHRLLILQKMQILLLSLIGLGFIIVSREEIFFKLIRSITVNHEVIALVISVSFLRLVVKINSDNEILPKGDVALWKTMGGIYLFSAVINLSAIMIFADRLFKSNGLHKTQIMMLTRMFGANALWSPFFVSMGVALTYSGGAELTTLIKTGLSLAVCSFILTGLQGLYSLKLSGEVFEGYPMHVESLSIPVILSLLVVLSHNLFPDISILIIISSAVMSTVLAMLFLKQPKRALLVIKKHIEHDVCNSASEISLFFSAGILAIGISSFVLSVNYQLPIVEFTGYHAAVTLICMVLVSFIGIHPIINISVLGGLLAPLSPDPNLLGMMFVFSWGLSIPLSPFSAISLMMQSRYSISALEIIRINAFFTIIMLLPACLALILYVR